LGQVGLGYIFLEGYSVLAHFEFLEMSKCKPTELPLASRCAINLATNLPTSPPMGLGGCDGKDKLDGFVGRNGWDLDGRREGNGLGRWVR
jgi:hypothetical protein